MKRPGTTALWLATLITLFAIASTAHAAPWSSKPESCTAQNKYFEAILPDDPSAPDSPDLAVAPTETEQQDDAEAVKTYEASMLNLLYATEGETVEVASARV